MADILKDLEDRLEDLTEIYESQLNEDFDMINIRNKVLSECLKNQIELQMAWEELHNEMEFLCFDAEDECERMFSIAFRELSEDSHKALSYNEAKLYAQSNMDYVETKRVFNKAKGLKLKCSTVVESLKTRKYILKNICDTLRDGNDNHII